MIIFLQYSIWVHVMKYIFLLFQLTRGHHHRAHGFSSALCSKEDQQVYISKIRSFRLYSNQHYISHKKFKLYYCNFHSISMQQRSRLCVTMFYVTDTLLEQCMVIVLNGLSIGNTERKGYLMRFVITGKSCNAGNKLKFDMTF